MSARGAFFDAQWISTQAKDGLNAVGIGAWFNVLDLGQVMLVHVVVAPLAVGVVVAWHILLVRKRGVVPPLEAAEPTETPVLVVGLAAVFGSPDEPSVTLQQWANADPADFVTTATMELDGTSTSASYGAPYNANGDGQTIGPLELQEWAGVRLPGDSAEQMVVGFVLIPFIPGGARPAPLDPDPPSGVARLLPTQRQHPALSAASGRQPRRACAAATPPQVVACQTDV